MRSKTRCYNEGEKNTKYFLNLEKRHYREGKITQIKLNGREFVTLDETILTECVRVLFLDFEKAFDTIELYFIRGK